jgi:hypothetical protein
MVQYDLLLKNGRVVDPINNVDGIVDVAITDGKIAAMEPTIDARRTRKMLDVSGRVVVPGIIDPHVHIRTAGHQNMAKVRVITAVDVAAPMMQVLESTQSFGSGMNIAAITSIHHQIKNPHPDSGELDAMIEDYLAGGALGVKVIQEPFPHETILRAIVAANEKGAYAKLDCGVTEEGSNILGLRWIVGEVGKDLRLDIAHINSYCRGQVNDPIEEALEAISLLEGKRNLQSESYLGIINGTSGRIVDGVPLNGCTRDCLRLGGYPETTEGMKQAMLDGYCKVPFEVAGETVLLEGRAALNVWQENDQRGVSFPVNVPSAAILLATRKDVEGQFVIDSISTDGGSIPRNVIISAGLALVRYGALALNEFILKTSYNPSRMFGMVSKGHLGVNMDADMTVLDLDCGKAVMGVALGRVIMIDGLVVGNRGTILTTEKGVDAVKAASLPYQTIDLHECGLYA